MKKGMVKAEKSKILKEKTTDRSLLFMLGFMRKQKKS